MEILGHKKWKILRDHHHGFAKVTPVYFGAALSGVAGTVVPVGAFSAAAAVNAVGDAAAAVFAAGRACGLPRRPLPKRPSRQRRLPVTPRPPSTASSPSFGYTGIIRGRRFFGFSTTDLVFHRAGTLRFFDFPSDFWSVGRNIELTYVLTDLF